MRSVSAGDHSQKSPQNLPRPRSCCPRSACSCSRSSRLSRRRGPRLPHRCLSRPGPHGRPRRRRRAGCSGGGRMMPSPGPAQPPPLHPSVRTWPAAGPYLPGRRSVASRLASKRSPDPGRPRPASGPKRRSPLTTREQRRFRVQNPYVTADARAAVRPVSRADSDRAGGVLGRAGHVRDRTLSRPDSATLSGTARFCCSGLPEPTKLMASPQQGETAPIGGG
jgi:hypothetical protein